MSAVAPTPQGTESAVALARTPLYDLHLELGAKMVPFAGYEMPVSYPAGILREHRHCREAAVLFDVSHMGQVSLSGPDAAAALETLVPVDVVGLAPQQQRYAFFTNTAGGILDDLMITRRSNDLLLVVNAACRAADQTHLVTHIGHRCTVRPLPDLALLALQGPKAASALGRLNGGIHALRFMNGGHFMLAGTECFVTRSGYTGEDGFEISVPADYAMALARSLLAQEEVQPAGLGARDTLRLEAGLCLYGHDITAQTTPIEAGLGWAIQKVRRPGGARAGHYPGADVIASQLQQGTSSRRVGLVGLERAPVREGTPLLDGHGHKFGIVCSGTIGPSVNQPVAMAYLPTNHAAPGGIVHAEVRGKRWPMKVVPMPFAPHRYFRG